MFNYSALEAKLLNNCLAFGLFTGFTWSIDLMTEDKASEYYVPIFVYCPLITLLYNPSISSALNGGFNVHIS
jgi:hypothetical protein